MTRARHGLWLNLGVALLSAALGLAALEVAVRLLRLNREAANPHVLRNVAPGKLSYLPGTTQRYETREFDFTIVTNRFGRRDAEWTQAALDDPSNAILIGDSFVLGYGVPDSSTQSTRLERAAAREGRPLEVFNFGFTGGPIEYVALLREALALGVEARLVVVGIFLGNDFTIGPIRTPAEERAAERAAARRRLGLPRSALAHYLKQRVVSSPRAVGALLRLGDAIGAPLYSSPQSFVFLRNPSDAQRAHIASVLAHLAEMRSLCIAAGRTMAIAVFPNKIQVENPEELTSSIYDADRPNAYVREFCERERIACLDLTPALRAEFARTRTPLYFPVDRHLTEHGNAVAAEALYEFVRGLLAIDPAAGR
jgi:hypothetical protein